MMNVLVSLWPTKEPAETNPVPDRTMMDALMLFMMGELYSRSGSFANYSVWPLPLVATRARDSLWTVAQKRLC